MPERSQAPIVDAAMRAAQRRTVWISVGSLAAPPAIVMLVPIDLEDLSLGEHSWLFAMFGLGALMLVEQCWRLPRPRPRADRGDVSLRAGRWFGVAGFAVAAMMYSLWSGTDVDPDDGPIMSFLHPLMPWMSAVCAIAGLVVLLRPMRWRVGPTHLTLSRPFGRVKRVPWSDVTAVNSAVRTMPRRHLVVHVRIVARGPDIEIPAQDFAPTMWVLTAWLDHYLTHPDDRYELASRAGIDRLDAIDAEHRAVPDRPWPYWFPPPLV
jgi:hypothetical protein